jgi:hypothetical protein
MIVFDTQEAVTPAGNPVIVPPVASVVVWEMLTIAVLIHKLGLEEATVTVLFD